MPPYVGVSLPGDMQLTFAFPGVPSARLQSHIAACISTLSEAPGLRTCRPAPEYCDVESENATADRVGLCAVSARSRYSRGGSRVKCSLVRKTPQRTRPYVSVGDCDRSAHPIRVTASQLCWLV